MRSGLLGLACRWTEDIAVSEAVRAQDYEQSLRRECVGISLVLYGIHIRSASILIIYLATASTSVLSPPLQAPYVWNRPRYSL